GRWYTERHTCKFTVKRRNYFSYGFCSTCRRRDNVVKCRTSASPVFNRRSVYSFLRCSGSMNSCHKTFYNTEVVMHYFRKWRKTVGSTGSFGEDFNIICKVHVVYTHYDHRRVVFRWSGKDYFLCTRIDESLCRVCAKGQTGRFNDILSTELMPSPVVRVLFGSYTDFFTVYDKVISFCGNFAFKLAVYRIILQHIRHILSIDKVIDPYNFDVVSFGHCSEDQTANSTESVDSYFDC